MLSISAARRLALAAQGFARPAPGRVDRRILAGVLAHTKLFQIDSVSAAVRAHYSPLFSRAGPYGLDLLDAAASDAAGPRTMVEYWAHEAALIPVGDWPLFRWRMEKFAHGRYGNAHRVVDAHPTLVDEVLGAIAARGPSTSAELERELDRQRVGPKGPWWDHTEVKVVCEMLFATGVLSVADRVAFTRRYDLAERVVGQAIAARRIDAADAVRTLVEQSVHALGVGTASDIADYYRLTRAQTTAALRELVDADLIEQVAVAGWDAPAYRHPRVRTPRALTGSALLCPFDPVVFCRPRIERLFDFHYRIEIYTPEHKRRFGYYVFPFLSGEELVARVDIRADRARSTLRVPGAFGEAGRCDRRVVFELAQALTSMAQWLDLDTVEVGDRGDLCSPLTATLTGSRRRR